MPDDPTILPDEATILPDDPIAEPDDPVVEPDEPAAEDTAAAAVPQKPKLCPLAVTCSALAGLAFLFMLVETAFRAAAGIVGYSTPAWLYWPWAVAIKQMLFLLLPTACFALSLFGAKRRRPVFLLLAIAWQGAVLLYDIWYIGQADVEYIPRVFLPMLLSLAAMLVLLAKTDKAVAAPPLAVAGVFAGVLVAHISLESIFYYAISPYWGPEGIVPTAINVISLLLLAPFYIRRRGRVRAVNIVFLSLALLYQTLFLCGPEAISAILYAAYGQAPLPEALGAAVPDLCILASLVIALVFAAKAMKAARVKKRSAIATDPIGIPEEPAESYAPEQALPEEEDDLVAEEDML